jgi:hypothetical protein
VTAEIFGLFDMPVAMQEIAENRSLAWKIVSGYTFRFCSAGGVDAVESEFGEGREATLGRPQDPGTAGASARWRYQSSRKSTIHAVRAIALPLRRRSPGLPSFAASH